MGVKYRVDKTFFNTWSLEMVYVLGFLYADGNIQYSPTIRAKYIRVTNTDHDRIKVIKKIIRAEHPITILPSKSERHKQRFHLRIGSHKLYDRLVEIGMTQNKSLTMLFPRIPFVFIHAFIRGYFDGDGCVCIEHSLVQDSRAIKRMRTIFTSGSPQFLLALKTLLETHAGMDQAYFHEHTKKGAYQLCYSTKQSVRLFKFMYQLPLPEGLYLKRKYAIFMQYFQARPKWADSEVQGILRETTI